jgi:hypothetical protein
LNGRIGCYGSQTKEEWEAEQRRFFQVRRECCIATGGADLLPVLEREQREFLEQWPQTWERISNLPSWRTYLARRDRSQRIADLVERCLLAAEGCSNWLGVLWRQVRTLCRRGREQVSPLNRH